MECREAREYVDCFIDNEIEPHAKALVEEHLASCAQCQRVFAFQERIKSLLKAQMKRVQAPDALRQRIITQINQLERDKPQWESRWYTKYVRPEVWVPAVVGLLLLAAFLWMADLFAPPVLMQDVVNRHVQYVTQRPPEGVYSGDAVALRQWLSTQLSFAVPVHDIQGLKLVGGRLEQVGDRQAANLLYQKGEQIFSLFILPEREEAPPFSTNRQVGTRSIYVGQSRGYTVVLWQDQGIYCAFVGNLPEKEVLQYALKAMGS